jgi:mono/diheme cytochrome c family protein
MNTSKQINVMIVLLCILLVGVGAYTIWDPFRAEAETERTKEKLAERAAHTFVLQCQRCHGAEGEGRLGLGPALNPTFRKQLGLTDFTDPAKLRENQQFVRNTIECGRIGTVMPPWSTAQGGALSDEQIRQLVILITENPGNAWEEVARLAAEENARNPLPSEDQVREGASITGALTPVCGQRPIGEATPPVAITPPPAATTWNVVAIDDRFVDQQSMPLLGMTIPAGQEVTVTLANQGRNQHNWAVRNVKDTQGRDVKTQILNGGQSATIRFTIGQTGSYEFFCEVHPVAMRGRLFVQ